jgi:hypothetical protein
MSLFGNNKSSTSTTGINKTLTSNNVDYSTGNGNKFALNASDSNLNNDTITTTDFGAVQAGIGVAAKALDTVQASAAGNLQTVAGLAQAESAAHSNQLDTISSLAENIKTDGQTQTSKLITYIAIAMVLGVTIIGGILVYNHQGKS